MSKPKFLYIDDENDASVEAIRDGFNDVGIIEVTIEAPKPFGDQRKYLQTALNEYDGLILDLRLDGNMKLDVAYNAPAIAQEIRTVAAETKSPLKARPIILCSTDEKMRATYSADKTSHDLFDYKFLKGVDADWPRFSRKLNSLANWYNWLNESEISIDRIFGRKDSLSTLDLRIVDRFLEPGLKSHEISHFVIKELFHHPGPLIKERVLAARFGIDIDESSGWKEVKEKILGDAKFCGLFSDGWDRWWSDIAATIFKNITGVRLAALNAQERVSALTEKTGIKNLKAAVPLKHCISTDFWTICEGYKKPLDPLEGFKVYETSELKAWQEHKFISLNAVIERVGIQKGLKPHPSENDRIESQKSNLK